MAPVGTEQGDRSAGRSRIEAPSGTDAAVVVASTGKGAGIGCRVAKAALVVGLAYTAVSVYWGLGGTGLLSTLGGTLAREGRAGDPLILVAVWAAAILKGVASVLPLMAINRTRPHWHRAIRFLAWVEAAILTGYGLVLTATGLLLQIGAIHSSSTADHRALAWHAYLWDPWFLLWGVLVVASLIASRARRHTW